MTEDSWKVSFEYWDETEGVWRQASVSYGHEEEVTYVLARSLRDNKDEVRNVKVFLNRTEEVSL